MPNAQRTVSEECRRCGATVELDDAFCRQCGGGLGAEPTGPARAGVLSWVFYPLLMLGTAAAVYAFLETRRPAPSPARQGPGPVAAPRTVAPVDGGHDLAAASPQKRELSEKLPYRPSPKGEASKRRTVGAPPQKGGARLDAGTPKPKRRIVRAPADAGPSWRRRDAGSRKTLDAGRRAKIDAGLSPREVARARVNAGAIGYVVNHHRVRLRRCLERLTKKGLEPSGLVEIHLSVGADGRALRSKVHSNATAFPSLGRCIANEMARWRYPRPAGGRAELIYPFRFSSGK